MKKVLWGIVVCLAVLTGLIPISYLFLGKEQGFFELKDKIVLANAVWNIGFYTHIFSGGIAILTGWVQFNKKILKNKTAWHRSAGKVYIITALLCSASGILIGFYATGGRVASAGFISIGGVFFYSTLVAFIYIKNGQIKKHQQAMTYSYAACLGAVTLRLYMPPLVMYFGNYYTAYAIVAWLSWVPNMFIAYWINSKYK